MAAVVAEVELPSDDEEEEEVVAEKVEEEPEVQEDTTLANSDVVTKYQEAAKIANATLIDIIALCVPGARIVDVCRQGDAMIEQRVALIFRSKGKNGKVMDKGGAFPVCLSVNELVCHVSPLESEIAIPALAANDTVKIDMGVHIDGYIAVVAQTIIVPGAVAASESAAAPVVAAPEVSSAARDNVMRAAMTAVEVSFRLLKAGNTNTMITQAIKKVAAAYGVKPISGTVMHQMKRFVIDGNKMILLREQEPNEQKVEVCTFEPLEVYALDIALSTGEGKPRDTGLRTTVYKRAVDRKHSLKVKASRAFFNDVNRRFPTLPFSLRAFPDEKAAKMGIRECANHELLVSYPVLSERAGDHVAHFKCTVLMMSTGSIRITGSSLEAAGVTTQPAELPVEIQELLAQDMGSKKQKKKAAAKKKKAEESA